jgi:murein DD-endopeptidase MepM/ murein hydrolase activator NlpD
VTRWVSFVRGTPILFSDPTGHKSTDDCGPDNIYCGGLTEPLTPEQIIMLMLLHNSPAPGAKKGTGAAFGDPKSNGTPMPTDFTGPNADEEYKNALIEFVNTQGVHPGIDLNYGGSSGNLLAIGDGKVIYSGCPDSGGCNKAPGYVIIIEHNIDGTKYYSVYFHVKYDHPEIGSPAPVGTTVNAGDVIGQMGNSGTHDVHLHFEIRRATTVGANGPTMYWPNTKKQVLWGWIDISPAFGGMGYGWGYLGLE